MYSEYGLASHQFSASTAIHPGPPSKGPLPICGESRQPTATSSFRVSFCYRALIPKIMPFPGQPTLRTEGKEGVKARPAWCKTIPVTVVLWDPSQGDFSCLHSLLAWSLGNISYCKLYCSTCFQRAPLEAQVWTLTKRRSCRSPLLHLPTTKDKWGKSKEAVKSIHHCLIVFILITIMVSNNSSREIKDLHVLWLHIVWWTIKW